MLIFFNPCEVTGQSADVKLEFHELSTDLYSVRFLIRSEENRSFILGSQNYRIYYNRATVEPVEKSSYCELDQTIYSNAKLVEQLLFDLPLSVQRENNFDQMGLLNFEVNLLNPNLGGTKVTDQWEEVISFQIEIEPAFQITDLIIAQNNVTSHLATAFVELSEWKAPYNTIPIHITVEENKKKGALSQMMVETGPNPTQDHLNVLATQELKSVAIYDRNGRLMKSYNLSGYATRIDLSTYVQGMYLIEIEDVNGSNHTERVVKINASI